MSLHQQMMGGPTGQASIVISHRAIYAIVGVIAAGIMADQFVPDYVETLRASWLYIFVGVVLFSLIWTYIQLYITDSTPASLPKMFDPMPFTFEDLKWYDGTKNSKAARLLMGKNNNNNKNQQQQQQHPMPQYDGLVFVAVKGVVYNVAHEYYGPGAGYSIFSAKDSSRQLGKVIVADTECNCDWTTLDAKQRGVLDDWESRYRSKYPIVGWVVPDGKEYEERAEKF